MLSENKKLRLSNQSRTEPVRFTATGQKLSSNEREIIQRRVQQELTYMDHPAFWKFGAGQSTPELPNDFVGGTGAFTQQLTKKQETDLFLRMNYARFRLSQEILQARKTRISINKAKEILRWHRIETDARARLVQSNLPLVLYMANKARVPGADFADVVSEGNMAMLRAIDGFDCSRGFKFSTYAYQAIIKSFAGLATKNNKYRLRFPTEFDPSYEKSDWPEVRRDEAAKYHTEELAKIVASNSAGLTAVELTVIKGRFALGGIARHKTLMKMGQMLGLSKERIRQIQKKAVGKLRHALEERLNTSSASAGSVCYAAAG